MCLTDDAAKAFAEAAVAGAIAWEAERVQKRAEGARTLSDMMRTDLGVEVTPERLAEWLNERWSRVSVVAHAIRGH